MERQQRIGPPRSDEQSVEITFAIFTGVFVFLGLVIPAVEIVHILGLADAGWGPIGAVGLLLAAGAGLASTINIVVRARQRGL